MSSSRLDILPQSIGPHFGRVRFPGGLVRRALRLSARSVERTTVICHVFALPEAPTRSAAQSASHYALLHGASSGASPCLPARQKTKAIPGSKATSKAFDPSRDAPFAAMPRPLGRDKVLAARAALPSGISSAPRRAPRLGTPSGGASRAVPARPARSAGSALNGPPQTSSLPVGSESVCPRFSAAPEGVPKRREACARGAGLCPPLENRPVGGPIPAGAGIFRRLPPILARRAGEELRAGRPSPSVAGPQKHAPRWARQGANPWGALRIAFFFSRRKA